MLNRKKVLLTVISPIFNEQDSIELLYKDLKKELIILGEKYEVIFVDDGSSDGSPQVLERLARRDKLIKVISFNKNYGQTAAITAGLSEANGKIILFIDSDLQNDPADFKLLLKKIDEGFDVVSGWRKNRKDPYFTRVLPSNVANRLISFMTGVKIHDFGCTLKAYKREYIMNIRLYGEMHRFIPAYAAQNGALISEVVVRHHSRKFGHSHYGLWRIIKVIFDVSTVKFLSDYSSKPLYLFGSFSVVTFFLAIVIFLFVVVRVVFFAGGWISPMILLSGIMVILSFQFFLIGLLAEILVRIYFESTNRVPYVIKKTMNI